MLRLIPWRTLIVIGGLLWLIRYTLGADADLSGTVDLSDFTRLAANFNGTNTVWTSADFNYDGVTGLTDFTTLAANFNQSLPSALPGVTATASPFAQRRVGADLLAALDDWKASA